MPVQAIHNPGNVWGEVSNPLTSQDPQQFNPVIMYIRANEVIAANQAVAFVAPTSTVPLSVEVLDVSDAFAAILFAGVALDAASAAGKIIRVITYGPAICNTDAGDTPAVGDVATKGAADGKVTTGGTLGGTWDGSDVAGTAVGTYLSAKIGSTNTAWIFVGRF